MSEYINNELIENTYLFCIKRVANSDTAKDLSLIHILSQTHNFIHNHRLVQIPCDFLKGLERKFPLIFALRNDTNKA